MGRGPVTETLLLGLAMVTLVPIRVVLAMTVLVIYYLICRVCTLFSAPNWEGKQQEDYAQLIGWRRGVIVRCGRFLSRMILFVFDFYWIHETCRDPCSNINVDRLMKQEILRIGCYELVKLEMPPHVVVNENVNLAKIALRPGAGNMVNGILRKLVSLKESNTIPVPSLDGVDRAQARALATIHSHPVVLAILEELPDGTKKKLAKK